MSVWIYTDADNTLWDTDSVFAEAQLALLKAAERFIDLQGPTTERLEFVREFDQAIAARHHLRLRYPPTLLVHALSEGIRGCSPDVAAQRVLVEGVVPTDAEAVALQEYARTLATVPPLLKGVRDGLELARKHDVPVYVISEGPLESLQARLRALELEQLTTGALSAIKSRDLFARLKQRAAPQRALMIGDQLDRDVQFAHEAGLQTILVKGRFRPNWTPATEISHADAVVDTFLSGIDWALQRSSLPQG